MYGLCYDVIIISKIKNVLLVEIFDIRPFDHIPPACIWTEVLQISFDIPLRNDEVWNLHFFILSSRHIH
jgi:hypothetical protein